MRRLLSYLISISLLLLLAIVSYGHGLRVKGNNYPIKERTGVDLFFYRSSLQHRKVLERFTLQFDFRLDQPQASGNIIRIKLDEPNSTLNIFCRQLDNGYLEIKLVEEGLDQLGTILLESQHFSGHQWIHLSLSFDLTQQKIIWHVLGKNLVIPFPYQRLTYNNVYFGKSDFSIDIADFSMRNLKVAMDNELITFPLKESSGSTVHSVEGNPLGKVENPVWLINESYYWHATRTLEMTETGGYQFDAVEGRLLFFDRQSLTTLDLRSGTQTHRPFDSPLPVDIRLGNSFLRDGKLYIYEVNDLPVGSPTIVEIDLATLDVHVVSTDFVPMQLHHHTGQPTERIPYLLFGGFGNDRYSNAFLSLDTATGQWDTVATSGDPIMPRYFTSSFFDPHTNNLYLFGGMGNEAADNTIGRIYRYDFYLLDLKTYRLRKLWEIQLPDKNVVPVKNLIYDGTGAFYTLLYPEYRSASALQLYRFSIENGDYTLLGDTIPIRSEKIKTNANLFFYAPLNTFYAITQVFDSQEVASQITVYELKAPAVSHAELIQYDNSKRTGNNLSYVWLLVIPVAVFIGFWMVRKKARQKAAVPPAGGQTEAAVPFVLPDKNALYLFGKFEAFDAKGANIAHLFSSRLKQVLVLFLSRYPNGIESNELSTLLWPEKELASTKNIRGVTLNQFRKLLANFTGISLAYQDNEYQIQVSECFVDYLHFKAAHQEGKLFDPVNQTILSRGKFLRTTEHELLDDIKDGVDRVVVATLQQQLKEAYARGDYERTIQLAKLCLETAPVDLEAFRYEIHAMLNLKQRTEALRRFEHFNQFYQNLMNESLPFTFKSLEKPR